MLEPERVTKETLIAGISGQDGSHWAAVLLDKGDEVHGIRRRRASLRITPRMERLESGCADPDRLCVIGHLRA